LQVVAHVDWPRIGGVLDQGVLMTVHLGHFRTTAAALVAGLLLVLAGCGGDDGGTTPATMGGPASSTATPEADPLAGAPATDACYKMKYSTAQAATNNSNPVNCYDDHTTVTYYVGQFPEDAAASDPEQVRTDCSSRLADAVGLTKKQLKSTVFDWVWFEPTTSQWAAGARWFRCDAVAESAGRLKKLPSGSNPIITGDVEDNYVRCVDNRNGQGLYVTCEKPHDYRWAGVFQAKGSDAKYPSRAQFEKQGKGCYKFTDNGAYWVTWPLQPGWEAGERDMNCYRKTSD
jgi:hypothetical protein